MKKEKHASKYIYFKHHPIMLSALLVFVLAVLFPIMADASAAHTREESVNWAIAQIGKGLDYDHMYGNQCVDLIKYYYDYLGHGGYAKGNAYEYKTNALPPGWVRVYGNYQPGDVAVWKTNHVAIITSADSVGFNAVNQNFNETPYCTQNWFKLSVLECAIRPDFKAVPQDTQSPVISNVKLYDITADGYSISCTVTDNAGVTRVSFPSWNADIHRGEQADWVEGTINGNTASVRVNIASLKSGAKEGNYMTHIYAYDAAGNVGSSNINNGQPLFIDRTRPLISDVYAEKIGREGYWVYCKVTDNLENNIDRVQFPTWTLYNDQDDLVIDWKNSSAVRGEKYGDCNYRFFVNINEHNQELGSYRTHIYAVDKYGNWGDYGGLQDIELTKDDTPSKPDNPNNPDTPDKPGNPDTPDNPDIPDKPDNPNIPDNPDTPDNPKPPVTPTYYTVKFQKNGGTKLSWDKVTVQDSQRIGTLPKVQRKGYTLKGWYTAKSGGSKISVSTRISKSQTLYAQWSKVKKPGRITSLSAKKVKKGKMKIAYRKVSGAAGYEIAYSSNSRFSKYTTYKINVKSASRTLSGLWKNQTYYVRVRAYKLDSAGNKVYGSYSAKKKVRV